MKDVQIIEFNLWFSQSDNHSNGYWVF